jgi:hypothetical protein
MANSYEKSKGRKQSVGFLMLLKSVWESENYRNLSHIARTEHIDTGDNISEHK